MRKNFIKQKNGFTLAELIVVIVLLGLVALIATSVTLMVNRTQQNYKIDSKSQTELVRLESIFKDLLMHGDFEGAMFKADGSSILYTKDTMDAIPSIIKFDNGTLLYFTEGEYEAKSIKFNSIKNITFTSEGNIICCTAFFENYQHKILYTMRAANVTQNFSSAGDNHE